MITVTMIIEEGKEIVNFAGHDSHRVNVKFSAVAQAETRLEARMSNLLRDAVSAALVAEAAKIGLGMEMVERREG